MPAAHNNNNNSLCCIFRNELSANTNAAAANSTKDFSLIVATGFLQALLSTDLARTDPDSGTECAAPSLLGAFRCRKLHSSSWHSHKHHPSYAISFQLTCSCRPHTMTDNFLQFVLASYKPTKSLLLQHMATHLLPHRALGVNQG